MPPLVKPFTLQENVPDTPQGTLTEYVVDPTLPCPMLAEEGEKNVEKPEGRLLSEK